MVRRARKPHGNPGKGLFLLENTGIFLDVMGLAGLAGLPGRIEFAPLICCS
jgi:hypothetical protein